MKQPKWTYANAIFAASLTFALTLAPLATSRAELVSEEVQDDAITPENSGLVEDVVIVKKKPARTAKKKQRVIVQEEPALEPEVVAQATATATASAKPTVGSTVDQSIQNKMDGVRGQFEDALVRTLDRIKITVDDGTSASATATATAVAAPTTVVQDSLVSASAAPSDTYVSVENAPAYDDEEEGTSLAEAKDYEQRSTSRLRIAPVIGKTFLSSDFYDVDSRYTAGFLIEMEVNDNLAATVGYSYSQYDIGLGSTNPFMGQFNPGFYSGNLNTLEYNQNLFEAGLRFYLLPRDSALRAFIGGGLGYNMGYLNYRQGVFGTWAYNPYVNLRDYEVKSFLGLLETGLELRVGHNVSVGANFKYANVFSANENQPLNNFGFVNSGFGRPISNDQRIVGGSLARDSFYSILGTVKVSF